jgi:type II secretory pathway predicted ATPase ExeA
MFLEHFGLKERPFGKSPDPRFLYPAPAHEEALARLEYAVEERDIMLLTGEIGCGKTTLTRALVDRLEGQITPVLIHNPRISAAELITALLRHLELDPAGDPLARLEQLQQQAFNLHQAGKPILLIIDEAQLIPERAVFDEIRLLTNFQLDDDNLLSVMLVGQPELRTRLQRPALAPLAQRLGMRYHLGPLDAKQTREMIRFRLETAGGDPGLITPEAAAAVHRATGGIPRLINTLCALSLLGAFGDSATRVEEIHVLAAAEEMGLGESAPAAPPAPMASSLRRRGRPLARIVTPAARHASRKTSRARR